MLTFGRICLVGGFFLAASFRKVTHFRCESVSSIPMLLSSSYYEKIGKGISLCMPDLTHAYSVKSAKILLDKRTERTV